MIGLSVEGPKGHNVCGVNIKGGVLVLDNEGKQVGPFKSLQDIPAHYIGKGWMLKKGTLRTIKISQIPGTVTNHSQPNVASLAWKYHKY